MFSHVDLCLKHAGNKPIFLPSFRTYPAVQLVHFNLKYKTFEIVIICYQDNSYSVCEFIKNYLASFFYLNTKNAVEKSTSVLSHLEISNKHLPDNPTNFIPA